MLLFYLTHMHYNQFLAFRDFYSLDNDSWILGDINAPQNDVWLSSDLIIDSHKMCELTWIELPPVSDIQMHNVWWPNCTLCTVSDRSVWPEFDIHDFTLTRLQVPAILQNIWLRHS